jgi:hypothetical protein
VLACGLPIKDGTDGLAADGRHVHPGRLSRGAEVVRKPD